MADRATASLDHIKNSGEFVRVPDFVIFDEHDEYDEHGKLLRRFDRTKLQKIVANCNRRQAKTGDLAVIAPGHSLDNPKTEEQQPPPWGYCADWRLGTYGPEQKLGILADAYIQKFIRTHDGRLVDGPEYVQSFPRRSPEVWPNHPEIPEHARDSIDWLALLRRAPQRDLGLSVYQRPSYQLSYSRRGELIGASATNSTGKLRYQMETPMADQPNPVDEPNAADNADMGAQQPPEGHEEFAKHLDYAMSNHPHLKHMGTMCKKYGLGEADPTATDTALPPGGAPPEEEDPSLQRNQRTDVQKTKVQRDIDQVKAELAEERKRLAIERQEQRVGRYQMQLQKLGEEFQLDIDVELQDCAGLDEKAFEKHVDRIKRNYVRTPVGGDLPYEAIEQLGKGEQDLNDPAIADKCLKYMRANPEWSQKHGDKAFMEAARALKLIN